MYLWGVSIVKKQIAIKKGWNIEWSGLFLKRKRKMQLDWAEYVTMLKYVSVWTSPQRFSFKLLAQHTLRFPRKQLPKRYAKDVQAFYNL